MKTQLEYIEGIGWFRDGKREAIDDNVDDDLQRSITDFFKRLWAQNAWKGMENEPT